jgi:hypothetical protein
MEIVARAGDLHYLRPNVAAVLVHIDLDGVRVHPASLAALAAGRSLASAWGATLYAAVIASDKSAALEVTQSPVGRGGADKLIVSVCDRKTAPLWASVGHAWQAVLDQLRPRVVLFGADAPAAIELGGRTASRIGARLLVRARVGDAQGADVELRDRSGAQFRVADSGAAVALIGSAASSPAAGIEDNLEAITLVTSEPPETRFELGATATAPASIVQQLRPIVIVADDVGDAAHRDAQRLATLLGGSVTRASAIRHAHADLCVTVGNINVDVAGCAHAIELAPPDVAEAVRRLEQAS